MDSCQRSHTINQRAHVGLLLCVVSTAVWLSAASRDEKISPRVACVAALISAVGILVFAAIRYSLSKKIQVESKKISQPPSTGKIKTRGCG